MLLLVLIIIVVFDVVGGVVIYVDVDITGVNRSHVNVSPIIRIKVMITFAVTIAITRLRFGSSDTRLEQLANCGEVGVCHIACYGIDVYYTM